MKYKFYSPVCGVIDYDFSKGMDYDSYLDESGMDELEEIDFDYLTGEELSAYEKEINEAIEKSWEQEDIDRKGLMYYFCCGFEDEKNKEILNKVAAAYPKIETVCGTAYSIMVCDTNQPLMKNEIEILKDYFAGQYSDGWGEGFSQRGIETEYWVLYLDFWSTDFQIETEDEFKNRMELEQNNDLNLGM